MLGRIDLRVALIGASALIASVSASQAQVELKTYMDDKGYLNVRALTCAQLANTFQEDADFLGAWYSGWWNGHLKRHSTTSLAQSRAFTKSSSIAKPIPTPRSSTRSTPM